MPEEKLYDIAIIGGGLAGLGLAIQSTRAGYSTLLIEKETYPFHRVCGEYMSLESWNFLQELGVPLSDLHLPQINEVLISAPNGNSIIQRLPLGGVGISRYLLDHTLSTIAKAENVRLLEGIKVIDVHYRSNTFKIQTSAGDFKARLVAGSFGKRSNLDIKWKRPFALQKPNKLNHYIAVKYHIQFPAPESQIALHNFENGYCGLSAVENNKQCLCYLTTARNLASCNNNIGEMEKVILMKNPFMKEIFSKATFLFKEPLTISQVAFNLKTQVENHVLLLGDAAGTITPLCGNGMSMALHSSKLAFNQMELFLQHQTDRYEMENQYCQLWEMNFARRLFAGRIIQQFFGSVLLSNLLISTVKPFPKLVKFLVKQTHGEPF